MPRGNKCLMCGNIFLYISKHTLILKKTKKKTYNFFFFSHLTAGNEGKSKCAC